MIEDRTLVEEPRVHRHYKLMTAGAALYLVMPFDAIPDFIPVVGHFDDAIVIGLVSMAVKNDWLNAFPRFFRAYCPSTIINWFESWSRKKKRSGTVPSPPMISSSTSTPSL